MIVGIVLSGLFSAGFAYLAMVLWAGADANGLRCPNETGSPCDGNACDALGCARIPDATPGKR